MNRSPQPEGTTMKDLAEQTPAEVDGQLFPILDNLARLDSQLANYRYLLGEVGRVPTGFHPRNVRDGLEYNDPGFQRSSFEESKTRIEAEIDDLETQAKPFFDEFNRRPWTRYVLVPGGHLHVRSCHTLTPGRTMVGQVAEASGLDADEVVGKYDVVACTHCFPDAPVEPKKTPAEEGFCAHSGEYVPDDKLPDGWQNRYVAPSVKCECGHWGAITKTGKFRRHRVPA